jgi:EAL domain-containing protein (putative c-di-GMP-specific phosphodiesterase class I)
MTVVAEGVEYEYQRKYLENKRCDIYQGYLFAKPVTKQECVRFFLRLEEGLLDDEEKNPS